MFNERTADEENLFFVLFAGKSERKKNRGKDGVKESIVEESERETWCGEISGNTPTEQVNLNEVLQCTKTNERPIFFNSSTELF